MRAGSLFLAAFVSVSAWAGGECRKDVMKFCKGTPIGDGRVAECLKSHESEVSPSCKVDLSSRNEKREKIKAEWKAAYEACKGDVESVCKGVQHGQGRIHRCLKEHEAQLSAACKSKVEEIKAQ